jgi:hypothetical protein
MKSNEPKESCSRREPLVSYVVIVDLVVRILSVLSWRLHGKR